MKKHRKWLVTGIVAVLALLAVGMVAARSADDGVRSNVSPVIPQPDVTIRAYPSYARDIQPVFNESCVSCHTGADAPNGLHLNSYDGVIKGTKFGAVVAADKPAMSSLVALVKHESDPRIWMPYHKDQLSPNRIKNIENWIRYGARNN